MAVGNRSRQSVSMLWRFCLLVRTWTKKTPHFTGAFKKWLLSEINKIALLIRSLLRMPLIRLTHVEQIRYFQVLYRYKTG